MAGTLSVCGAAVVCVVLLLLAVGLSGCECISGSGKLVTTRVHETGFTEIKAGDDWEVTVVRGDTYDVKVTTDDNQVDRLDVVVDGNALVLRFKSGTSILSIHDVTLRATVVMPTLTRLDLADSSEASVAGFSSGGSLTVSLNDSSSVALNALRADALDARAGDSSSISGSIRVDEGSLRLGDSSDATLRGSARMLALRVSDDCSLDLSRLRAGHVAASLGDCSDGTIAVDGTLGVHLGDDSSLKYAGSPRLESIHIGDGSSLDPIGAQGQ